MDLEDGPISIEELDAARRYHHQIAEAARKVHDPDLSAIAESYARVAAVLDKVDRYELSKNAEFREAVADLRPGDLVDICIDHGHIDERFRDGLP